jgi:hypothetical protein
VYTITIKRRIYKPLCLALNEKMFNALVKVNMANHVILVAVCYCLLIKLN